MDFTKQFDKSVLEEIARREQVPISVLEYGLNDGSIVILRNHNRTYYMGIGDNGIP